MSQVTYHILGIHPDSLRLPAILLRHTSGKEYFFTDFTGQMPKPSELEEGDEVATFPTSEAVEAWVAVAKANDANWIYALWLHSPTPAKEGLKLGTHTHEEWAAELTAKKS